MKKSMPMTNRETCLYYFEARERNKNLPGQGGVFNLVNSNLYHYAGNNPVKYVDPDGNDITNATGGYIIARLEDPITLPNGVQIDTAVIAPGETLQGAFDGTMDSQGNFTKVSSHNPLKVDYSVKDACSMKFTNIKSMLVNFVGDFVKSLENLLKSKDDKKLLSGAYTKESAGGRYLSEHWTSRFKRDLQENINDFEAAYGMENQALLREGLKRNNEEN